MSGHRVLHDIRNAPFLMVDPGNAGVLRPDRWGAVFPIVTAGAETRTLPLPTKAGLICTVILDVRVGDLTLTVTEGYNQGGTTTIVFDTAGDWVTFVSVKVGANYRWRLIAQEGTGAFQTNANLLAAVINALSSSAVNVTTLNVTNAIQQAQGAPEAVADGDTALTMAMIAKKILTMIATAGRAPTVPTGTQVNAALAIGDSVDWSFVNLAAGAHTITVTAAAASTLVGKMTLAQNEQGLFRTVCTAANTAITYRLS
jgi:hypothetical protein